VFAQARLRVNEATALMSQWSRSGWLNGFRGHITMTLKAVLQSLVNRTEAQWRRSPASLPDAARDSTAALAKLE
jgi:hypothetical protein